MRFHRNQFVVSVALLLCFGRCTSTYANGISGPESEAPTASLPVANTVIIPGPLRSFLRMAGISQKAPIEDVLPLLAHNIYLQGYGETRQTEFLILLDRYVRQARELQAMAGPDSVIRVEHCEDAGPLLHILGYRLRQGCGQKNNIVLVTAEPERAFLTIDSGFPLTTLEESLGKDVPFIYDFPVSRVPTMFTEGDWMALSAGKKIEAGNLLNVLLHDPAVPRLYWALSKIDSESRIELKRSPGLGRLLPHAPVLDFYGGELRIRSGRVVVPSEATSELAWKDLVGVSPKSPGEFVLALLSKDNGWLAAYFDVLSRVDQVQQGHLTQAPRMKRLYEAFRSPDQQSSATRGVFRKAPDLLVLYTRLGWDKNGDPRIPGDLNAWKDVVNQKSDSKVVRDLSKRARSWDRPEQLLEAITSFSRVETDIGPLQIYIMLNEIDNMRLEGQRLSPATVRLMGDKFAQFNNWYPLFAEFPDLDDTSIAGFLKTADQINSMPNQPLRGNLLGALQANIGLWQIFARQGQIQPSDRNGSWQKLIAPFTKIATPGQLFDAVHGSLGEILIAATGKANSSQDEIIDLLAGPPQKTADGQRMHQELVARIHSVLDDQRLVSLDTLAGLGDGLHAMAQGSPADPGLLTLAGELREFEMPRPIFTNSEKISWAPAVYSSRHAELQVRTDLTRVIKTPGTRVQLEAARGQLAPFLRDTLVGLNYAYYEPAGAQMLHHNPLFVRAHDFSGMTVMGPKKLWSTPELFGAGTPAAGGAYLMGSLADLPFALASTEQDFIAPENVQALIWKELVPNLLASATVSRWWDISPNELHAVTLYQRFGEDLLTASVKDQHLRGEVVGILSDHMSPQRLEALENALQRPEDLVIMLPHMMPSETFYLAGQFRERFPADVAVSGPIGKQLNTLLSEHPAEGSWTRISRDFGVPHPTLARSYGRDLLHVKPLPFFGWYSSRLFGESWESGNLYWARLADEAGYTPVTLNRIVPELTRHMISKIFATDLEDWPALLRAMQETGDEFRKGKIALAPAMTTISQR